VSPGPCLVIGVGNAMVGEDAFGGTVIALLRRRADLPAGVDLVDAQTDLLAFIDRFAAYDRVIVVDAVIGAGRAGEIAAFDEQTFAAWPDTRGGAHQVSALTALGLFRTLYPDAGTRITLVALSVDRVSSGTRVPEAAIAAGAELVARLWFAAADHKSGLQ